MPLALMGVVMGVFVILLNTDVAPASVCPMIQKKKDTKMFMLVENIIIRERGILIRDYVIIVEGEINVFLSMTKMASFSKVIHSL